MEDTSNPEGPTFFGNILNRMKKTSNFFYDTANVIKELTNDINAAIGTIHTIDPTDSYFWMLKIAMKHTRRNFQLQKQKLEWSVEDYMDNMNKLQLDFFGFIRSIKILIPFNITAMGFILVFIRRMFLRLLQKNKKYLAIENGNGLLGPRESSNNRNEFSELTEDINNDANLLTYKPSSNERRLTRRQTSGGRLTRKNN